MSDSDGAKLVNRALKALTKKMAEKQIRCIPEHSQKPLLVRFRGKQFMVLVSKQALLSDLKTEIEEVFKRLFPQKRLLPVKELRNTSSAVLPLWYPVEPLLKDNEHVFALCNGFEENEETLRGHLDISETEDSSGYISVRQRDGNSTPLPVKQNLLSSTELQDSHDTHKRSKRSKRKRKLQKADEYGPVNSTQGKARLSELEGELQPESEVIRPAASNSIRESGSKLNVSTSTVSVNAISGETRDENGVKQKKIRKNSIQKEVSPSVEKSLAQVEVAEAVNTSARKPSTLSAELSERTTDDESGSIKKQNHSKTERHTEIETAALSDENLISCQQENSLCHTTNDHHDLHSTKETANHEGRSENVSNIGFVYEKTKMKSSKSKGKEILETTGKDSEGVSKVRNESGTDECVFKSSRDTSGANSVGNLDSSMVSQETDKNMNKSSSKKKRKKSKDRESIKEDTDMVHAKSASKDHHLTEKQPVCESNSNLESDENFKKSSKKKKKDKSDKESKEREKNSVGESSAADDCSSRKKKKKHKNKEKGKGEKERVQRSTEKDAGEETVAQIDMKDHTAVNNLPSDENTVDGATKSKDEQEKDVVEVSSHLKQKISKPTNEDSFNKDSSPKNRKEKKRKHSDTCLSESNDTVSEAMLQNENNLKQGDSHETAKKKSESTELLSSQQTSQEIFKKPFSPSQELSQQSHQQSSQTTSQKIRTKRKKDEGSIDLFTDNSPGKESKQEQNITSMNQPIPKAPKFTSSSSDSESSSSLSISDYSGRIVRKLKQDKATKSGTNKKGRETESRPKHSVNLESPTVLKTYSKKKTIKSKKQSKLEESAKEQENIATDSQQEKLFSPSETLIEESDKEHRVIDWIEKLPDVDKFSHYQKPLDDLQGSKSLCKKSETRNEKSGRSESRQPLLEAIADDVSSMASFRQKKKTKSQQFSTPSPTTLPGFLSQEDYLKYQKKLTPRNQKSFLSK